MKSIFEHGKSLRSRYYTEYKRSIEDKERFFAEQARILLTFTKDFEETLSLSGKQDRISWFEGGELNACYNAVDRHAEATPEKVAIIYEDNNEKTFKLTYSELKKEVVRAANYLLSKGVKQRDTVCIYMPMDPRSLIFSLACARIGASHTVVFGGFSSDSLALRIEDSSSVFLVSADVVERGKKKIEYLENVYEAVEILSDPKKPQSLREILIYDSEKNVRDKEYFRKIQNKIKVELNSEITWSDFNEECPCVSVPSESVLFHLYTSGSTGRPKGLSHSTAGYLLYAALTTLVCFDIEEEDIFFCTAELGWITGHSYVLYGPLLLGITTVVFGGIPTHPDPYRLFRSVERHRATQLYTAPTVIRSLQKSLPKYLVRPKDLSESADELTPAVDHVPDSPASLRSIFSHSITNVFNSSNYHIEAPDESPLSSIDLSSLRVLGSVGEPINKSAYIWFCMFFGKGALPLIDTYWQTEAGGVMLSPLIGVTEPKPESVSYPFFGMHPCIIRKDSLAQLEKEAGNQLQLEEADKEELGVLLFKGCWPGIAVTIVNNHERYKSAYFLHPGYFYTGDEAQRDSQGYYWVGGRVDDVINVSGHRLSTAEIESAVCSVDGVAEAAALGQEDEVTGQSICIFIVKSTREEEDSLVARVKHALRKKIGAVVSPKRVLVCPELPKTSTGKMMRRVLRKILEGQEIGDTSTCINPDSIAHAKSTLSGTKL